MRFLFNMLNHSKLGQRSLEDVIGIMGHQLRALGHEAVWEEHNSRFLDGNSGYNIMVEGFTGVTIAEMARVHAEGGKFIILATEEPTDKGFNHGKDAEMVFRQESFPHAAKFATGIIHLVPGEHVTKWYSQFAPASYAELGYASTLLRIKDVEPEFDFGFYGSLSPRRHRILKRLAKQCSNPKAIKLVMNFPSQDERDAAMRQAKVIVQIRKFDEMGLVSSSRCNTALCLGRPVIAEPHDLAKPWDEVVRFSKTEDEFFSLALAVKAAWRGVHAGQLDKFKKLFTPEMSIGEPMCRIGVLSHAGHIAFDPARRAA